MNHKISAFVITKNEEKCIERALQTLKWADEIIVVDAESTDKTIELAKKYTDKVFIRQWSGFGDQRNFALSHCTHPWVFFLDADEMVSPDLAQWMLKFKTEGENSEGKISSEGRPQGASKNHRIDMFEFRRLEHFRGRLYKYGADNPSHQWRLFRREGAKFIGEIHEYITFDGDIKRVEYPILHFQPGDLTVMMDKVNLYTSLDAAAMYQRGVKHPAIYMLFSGMAQFSKSYFRKQGFRDGILGFILAVLHGTTFFLRQAKLYLLNKNI